MNEMRGFLVRPHLPVQRGTSPVVPRVVRARLGRRPSAVPPAVVVHLLLTMLVHHSAAGVHPVIAAVVALRSVHLAIVRVPE